MGILNKKFRKQLKGSVLLTVVCVMFVMLIIVTATLTLAANASNRAFADYQKNQATYTARSVINKTIETLQTDANGTGNMTANIFDYMDTNGGRIELQVNPDEAGALAGGYGTVDRVVLERVGIDNEDGYYISGTGESIVKITAHVTMGNKTVTYSQYVNNAKSNVNPPSGGSGFISLGGNGGFTSTNAKVYGPAGSNVSKNSTAIEKLLNEGRIYDEKFYNSSMYINTNTEFTLPMQKGIAVWGDLAIENSQVKINSDYDTTGNTDIKNIPYLYVDGTLGIKNNIKIGSDTKPVNIFAGRILSHTNAKLELNSSVYLYNDIDGNPPMNLANLPNLGSVNENNFSEFAEQPSVTVLGTNTGSGLLNWYTAADGTSMGGDFYSLGDVVIDSTNGNFVVSGNMFVKGQLYVRTGKLQVNGTLTVNGVVTAGAEVNAGTDDDPKLGYVNIIDKNGNTKEVLKNGNFPSEMEKAKIIEMTPKDTNNDGKDDIYEPGTDKFIKTKEDMYNTYYENPCADDKSLKGNVTTDSFPTVDDFHEDSNIYDNSNIPDNSTIDNPIIIDKNCAIVGTGANEDTFDPTGDGGATIKKGIYYFKQPDPNTDHINVVLVNVRTEGGTEFIIDETNHAPNSVDEGNVLSKFKVNFYIANDKIDGYATTFNSETIRNGVWFQGTKFWTLDYKKKMESSGDFEIDGTPGSFLNSIPYINLFGYGETTEEGKGTPQIIFADTSVFTGSIFAPNSEFTFKNSLQTNNTVTYKRGTEKIDVLNPKISVIGSAIVGQVKEMQNDATVFVVTSDGDGTGIHQDPNFSWTPINGFANY